MLKPLKEQKRKWLYFCFIWVKNLRSGSTRESYTRAEINYPYYTPRKRDCDISFLSRSVSSDSSSAVLLLSSNIYSEVDARTFSYKDFLSSSFTLHVYCSKMWDTHPSIWVQYKTWFRLREVVGYERKLVLIIYEFIEISSLLIFGGLFRYRIDFGRRNINKVVWTFQKFRQGLYSDKTTTTTTTTKTTENRKIKMQCMCNVQTKVTPVILVPTGFISKSFK